MRVLAVRAGGAYRNSPDKVRGYCGLRFRHWLCGLLIVYSGVRGGCISGCSMVFEGADKLLIVGIACQLKRSRETLARNAELRQNIIRELDYRSSLELDPRTYDTLRHIPLADEIVLQARKELVNRLDGYQVEHPAPLQDVVNFVQDKMMPVIKRYAVTGRATINTEDILFHDPLAVAMLIDIFSERGFQAMVDIHRLEIPEKVDLTTGEITTRHKRVYRMTVFFSGSKIRRG